MLKQNDAELRAIVNRLTAVAPGVADAGRFNGAKIALFTDDIVPSRATVLADLTQPTYTGYAISAAIVFGLAFTNDNGAAEVLGDGKQFPCTADGASQTVHGYMCLNAAGTGVLWAERFDTPQTIATAGQNIFVLPRYQLGRG